MSLPKEAEALLVEWGVPPDVRAELGVLCRDLGPEVLEALAEHVEEREVAATALTLEELKGLRTRVGARQLCRHHPRWAAMVPTPGLWRERAADGAAAGLAGPLGNLGDAAVPGIASVARQAMLDAGENQPSPRGLLILGRGVHLSGRASTFAFDLVPAELDDALAVNAAQGAQHTLPGSLGAASGTVMADAALLWEIQPNLFKPHGDMNRFANAIWRRHRNWHRAVTAAALAWLTESERRVFVLRGPALRTVHEANPGNMPLSADIETFHDRTCDLAARSAGITLRDAGPGAEDALRAIAWSVEARLSEALEERGANALVREVVRT